MTGLITPWQISPGHLHCWWHGFPASETGIAGVVNAIHFVAAALFLSCLAIFSLFLFTKGEVNPTPQKLRRNIVYIICGTVMATCLLALLVYFIVKGEGHTSTSFVFWAETVALVAFGISWLTKGGRVYPDRNEID